MIDKKRYSGTFDSCPVFLGCSDLDSHVPEERVNLTSEIMTEMGATVTKRIYKSMGHIINDDELNFVRSII